MTAIDKATAIAPALPGLEQKGHFGNGDCRVRTRVFASVPFPDQMTLHLDPEHARILIGPDPETYIPHPGVWGERGWIHVTLSRIDHDVLVDLIYESWSRIAPTRLLSPAQD